MHELEFSCDVEPHTRLAAGGSVRGGPPRQEEDLLLKWQLDVALAWTRDPPPLLCGWATRRADTVDAFGGGVASDGFCMLAFSPHELEAVVQYRPLVRQLLHFILRLDAAGLRSEPDLVQLLKILALVRRGCVEVQGGTVIVPVLALATPSLPAHCGITYAVRESDVVVSAGPGGGGAQDTVTLGYGGLDNASLFATFGVVVADNAQEYRIEGVQAACEAAGVTLLRFLPEGEEDVVLLSSSASTGPMWPGIPDDICELGTLCALRWMLCGEEELRIRLATAEDCTGPACLRNPLRHETELLVWEALARLCRWEMGRLPTTLVEDETVLAARAWSHGTAAAVIFRVGMKRLLCEVDVRLHSCIARGSPLRCPSSAKGAFDIARECARMPEVVRGLMLEEGRPEDTPPVVLLRALRLGEEQYHLAKEGAFALPRQVLCAPGILGTQACAELLSRVDRKRQMLADSVDGAPDHQLVLSPAELRAAVGDAAVDRIWSLVSDFAAAAGPDEGQFPVEGWGSVKVLLRRYSAETRPWIPFHNDSARVTCNICLVDDAVKGGKLVAVCGGEVLHLGRTAGDATIHSSSLLHAVTRVASGIRYSLVLFFGHRN